MNKFEIVAAAIFLFATSASQAADRLDKYVICVNSARAKAESPSRIRAYTDQGCTTNAAYIDLKGVHKPKCNENVCWNAPPQHIIISASILDHSSGGNSHAIGPTAYLPNREFTTSICTEVSAESGDLTKGRGWQKISADVDIKHTITEAERSAIEAECFKKATEQ